MELKEFIKSNNVDFTKNRIGKTQINDLEKAVGVEFGAEVVEYIYKYGYLGFEEAELYGVNSKQMLDSDMIKQTTYLHKYFPKTKKLVAIENKGDGYYILVDTEDNVYEYISEEDKLIKTETKLFQYILKRFEDIKSKK